MDEKRSLMDKKKLFLVSSSFLTAIFNTIALLAIAKNMDITTLGALGFILSFIGMITFIGDMGYTHAFIRALDKGHSFARCYSVYRVAKLRMTFILVGVGAVLIIIWQMVLLNMDPNLGIYQGAHPVHPASLALIVGFVASTNTAQIWITGHVARGKKGTQRNFDLIEAAIRMFMIIGMIQIGMTAGGQVDVFALAFVYITASTFGLIFLIFRGKKLKAKKADDEIILDMGDVAAKMVPYAAFACLILHIDKILIWYWHDLRDVGYYFGAQRLVIFVAASSGAIAMILGAALIRFKDDTEKIGNTLRMTERYITLMAVPVTIFYVIFSGDLLSQFLGSGFVVATDTAALLAVAGLFIALASPYLSYMVETDDYYHLGLMTGIAFAVNLGVGIILIPNNLVLSNIDWIHGMNGAGIAALAASITAYVGYRKSVAKVVEFSSNPRILLHLLCGAMMAFVIKFLIWYFEIEVLWYWLFIFAIIGAFIYGVMLYLTGEYLRKDFEKFKELVSEDEQ